MNWPWIARERLEAECAAHQATAALAKRFVDDLTRQNAKLLETNASLAKQIIALQDAALQNPVAPAPINVPDTDDLPFLVAQACELEADGDEMLHRHLRNAARKRLAAKQDPALIAQIITAGYAEMSVTN